jgi:hypothetical protein
MARRSSTPPKERVSLTYEMAPAVADIARAIIHEHHVHLSAKRLEYIFRSRHAKSGRKIIMGRSKIISGLNAFLALNEYGESVSKNVLGEDVHEAPEPFFVIEVAKDLWMQMEGDKKRALVDHLLCRCGVSGENLCLMQPDVSEFTQVVRRRGLWVPDLAELVRAAAGQTPLPLTDAPTGEPAQAAPAPDSEPYLGTAVEAESLLGWVTTLPMEDTQVIPLGQCLAIEVDSDTYRALRDKLGEDEHENLWLPGVYGEMELKCVVWGVPTGARWPGLDAEGGPMPVATDKAPESATNGQADKPKRAAKPKAGSKK